MTPREQRQLGDGEDAKPRHGFQAIGVDERSRLHCRIRPGYGPPMLWGARLLTLPVAAVLLCAAAPAADASAGHSRPAHGPGHGSSHGRSCDGVNLLSGPYVANGISSPLLGTVVLSIVTPLEGVVECQPVSTGPLGRAGGGGCKGDKPLTKMRRRDATKATHCLLEKERAKHGLSGLSLQSGTLGAAAGNHSSRMVETNCFAHQCSGEPDLVNRVTSAKYLPCDCSWQVGENIAWGRGKRSSPAAIVDAWMHSPPHRELILTGSIKDVGVGIKRGRPGDGKAKAGTYTADFGTKN